MSRLVAIMSSVWLAILFLVAVPVYAVDTSPTITSFAPTGGRVGIDVVITGTYFTAASVVKFNGVLVAERTVTNATTITAIVPLLATSGKISVSTVYGTATSTSNFTVAPSITSFTPSEVCAGETVVITGRNFTGTTKVSAYTYTQGYDIDTTYIVDSDTQITATIIPSGYFSAGAICPSRLSVTNAGGTTTKTDTLTILMPASMLISVNPGGGYIGDLSTLDLSYTLTGPKQYSGRLLLDGGGKMVVLGIHPGIYTVSVSGSHWLKHNLGEISAWVAWPECRINIALANGDANGDGQVNLFDFVVLDSKFNKSDVMADLDGDGAVTLFDYTIIDQYFGAQADL